MLWSINYGRKLMGSEMVPLCSNFREDRQYKKPPGYL